MKKLKYTNYTNSSNNIETIAINPKEALFALRFLSKNRSSSTIATYFGILKPIGFSNTNRLDSPNCPNF